MLMTFRTRMMVHLNGLLLVTVVLISGLTLLSTMRGLRENARRNALVTASLLAGAAEHGLQAPAELEKLVGDRVVGQVRAELIDRITSRLGVARMLEGAVLKAAEQGDLEAIFVADPKGGLALARSPNPGDDLVSEYYGGVDEMALETIKTRTSAVRFRGGSVEASVPLPGFGDGVGASVCRLSTRSLDASFSSALRDVVMLGVAGLLVGALVSIVLARRVSGPVSKLAEAARVIGSGGFDHRVRVESSDEVGKLAESFNAMADSLEAHTAKLARATAEKEVLARELDIAAEIQKSLLPEACPRVENFDIAASSVPAREVGGDFYDFIRLPEGRWGVVVADVSGKGVPAALLMALSRSLIRAYSQDNPSILRAMRTANRFLLEDVRSGMFVTCFYGVMDPVRRSFTYVNAGHNPPVVATGGDIVILPASGTPLGVMEESGIREETCQLHPGNIVIMYTDGITEAMNEYGEQFGTTRLEDIARNSSRFTAAEISERLLTAVRTFTMGQSQFDDMTAVVLKVS